MSDGKDKATEIEGFPLKSWRWDVAAGKTFLGYHSWAEKEGKLRNKRTEAIRAALERLPPLAHSADLMGAKVVCIAELTDDGGARHQPGTVFDVVQADYSGEHWVYHLRPAAPPHAKVKRYCYLGAETGYPFIVLDW